MANFLSSLKTNTDRSFRDSILPHLGGGGGQSGGTVVGGPEPWAATVAGLYQANAATAAAQAAQQATNDAILAMNHQYQQARYDVQPYRVEGVQALNQLNQYMGLQAYNPGAAPEAPKQMTIADASKKIKQNDINDFIRQNTTYVGGGADPAHNKYYSYNGPGAAEAAKLGDRSNNYAGGNQNVTGGYYSGRVDLFGDPVQTFGQGTIVSDLARKALAQQMIDDNQPQYEQSISAYKQNLDEYNQNKAWYDQYTAEGPYTSQQVSDKISNLPGYQAELQQGVDAIQKGAAAKGYLGSGRVLKELSSFGQNTLGKFYGNELDRLAGLAGSGQQAASQTAQNSMSLGGGLAGLYSNLGDTKANAQLSSGNAMAQALLAANQQYKIIGQQSSGGGGLGGLGSVLGGIGSIASAFSARTLKEPGTPINTAAILDNVKNLDVEVWRYKDIDRKHLGCYAEDFQQAFGVGDGKSINLIDVCGVLLASVKELSKQVDSLQSKLDVNTSQTASMGIK